MIHEGLPSFCGFGLEDGHVPTFWLLQESNIKLSMCLPAEVKGAIREGEQSLQPNPEDTSKASFLKTRVAVYCFPVFSVGPDGPGG